MGTCNDAKQKTRQDKTTQNRNTTDDEQIQLKVGRCNELFIAQERPGHGGKKRGSERGIKCERGETEKDGGRWRGDEQLNLSNPFAGGD